MRFFLILLSSFLLFSTIAVKAQSKNSGLVYYVSTDEYTRFKMRRSYSEVGNIFITTYNIYHPRHGRPWVDVVATHYKDEKKIVVKVDLAGGGLLSYISKETVTYTAPKKEFFGIRGTVGVLGGKRIPWQCAVQFISDKFENVNVCHIMGGSGKDYEFFVLE